MDENIQEHNSIFQLNYTAVTQSTAFEQIFFTGVHTRWPWKFLQSGKFEIFQPSQIETQFRKMFFTLTVKKQVYKMMSQ